MRWSLRDGEGGEEATSNGAGEDRTEDRGFRRGVVGDEISALEVDAKEAVRGVGLDFKEQDGAEEEFGEIRGRSW